MTSQGLKRPSEFVENATSSSVATTISPQAPKVGPIATNNINNQQSLATATILNNAANGSDKRRRLNEFNSDFHSNNNRQHHIADSISPFKDSSTILSSSLHDDIAHSIQDEIHKTLDRTSHHHHHNPAAQLQNGNLNNDLPLLSIRQTHLICEKLIRDREQKLREEYDRILACKLALTTTNLAFNLQQQAVAAAAMQQVHQVQQQQQRVAAVANIQAQHHNHLINHQHQLHHQQQQQLTLPSTNQLINQNCTSSLTNIVQSSQVPNLSIPCGPVLLASNLDEQLAVPENLFTLFGVFGDVIRVKILFNKKDNALIQMADSNQAQVAQGHLDKQKVFGKVIRVTRSKHLLVQMPRETNQSDAGLTKDFTNSPLHRFKIPGSRNYLNIYPPSNTLHISNIPATIDENDLQKAFKEACGFDLASFKFFPKDRKMALMKFNSIEHATIALVKMHNYQISEGNNLKVSFSKSIMQQ